MVAGLSVLGSYPPGRVAIGGFLRPYGRLWVPVSSRLTLAISIISALMPVAFYLWLYWRALLYRIQLTRLDTSE